MADLGDLLAQLPDGDRALLQRLHRGLLSPPLPGRAAQQTMAPRLRGEYGAPPADARRAAVLALLFPADGGLRLLYIQRTSPRRDRHAGQISFPGGSVDAGDPDTESTALRELEEEVGVPATAVTVLGAITPLYIPVSNFLVDPYVGYAPQLPPLRLQASEVARTLTVGVADLLEPTARRRGNRKLTTGLTLPDTPYWSVGPEEIWGATAMMTAEIVALLSD